MASLHPTSRFLLKALHRWKLEGQDWPLFNHDFPGNTKDLGVGLFVRPLGIPRPKQSVWLRRIPVIAANTRLQNVPIRGGFAVVWPALLKASTSPLANHRTRSLAWDLLVFAAMDVDLLPQYDPVLAELLLRNRALVGGWTGLKDEEALITANHIDALASNIVFIRQLARTVAGELKTFLCTDASHLGYCDKGRLCDTPACPVCEKRSWAREGITVFWGHRVNAVRVEATCAVAGPAINVVPTAQSVEALALAWGSLTAAERLNPPVAMRKPSHTTELARLLQAKTPYEGVYQYKDSSKTGHMVLVNFQRLLELAQITGRQSSLAQFIDPSVSYDLVGAGHRARLYYEQAYPQLVAVERKRSMMDVIADLGWPVPTDLSHPYTVFRRKYLEERLTKAVTRAMKAVRNERKKPKGPAGVQRRDVFQITFNDMAQQKDVVLHTMRRPVFKASKHGRTGTYEFYITLPYEMNPVYLQTQQGNGLFITWQGQHYVNKAFLQRELAYDATATPNAVLEARNKALLVIVERWNTLYSKKADYALQLRKLKLVKKIADAGPEAPVQSALWLPREITAIEDLAKQRQQRFAAFKKRLPMDFNEDDKTFILQHLSHRTAHAIREKLLELGFKYAMRTSYAAYVASGYCLRPSSRRRTAWLSKGVRLC